MPNGGSVLTSRPRHGVRAPADGFASPVVPAHQHNEPSNPARCLSLRRGAARSPQTRQGRQGSKHHVPHERCENRTPLRGRASAEVRPGIRSQAGRPRADTTVRCPGLGHNAAAQALAQWTTSAPCVGLRRAAFAAQRHGHATSFTGSREALRKLRVSLSAAPGRPYRDGRMPGPFAGVPKPQQPQEPPKQNAPTAAPTQDALRPAAPPPPPSAARAKVAGQPASPPPASGAAKTVAQRELTPSAASATKTKDAARPKSTPLAAAPVLAVGLPTSATESAGLDLPGVPEQPTENVPSPPRQPTPDGRTVAMGADEPAAWEVALQPPGSGQGAAGFSASVSTEQAGPASPPLQMAASEVDGADAAVRSATAEATAGTGAPGAAEPEVVPKRKTSGLSWAVVAGVGAIALAAGSAFAIFFLISDDQLPDRAATAAATAPTSPPAPPATKAAAARATDEPAVQTANEQRREAAPPPAAQGEPEPVPNEPLAMQLAKADLRRPTTLPLQFEPGSVNHVVTDSDALDAVVRAASAALAGNPGGRLEVGGHTSAEGDSEANDRLGQGRADAALRLLRARGVPADRTVAKSLGASMPIASDETQAGRNRNRRATIRLMQ